MEDSMLWEKVMNRVSGQTTPTSFHTFLKPLKVREIQQDPDIIYLQTDQEFHANIVNNRYLHLIQDTFRELTGKNYRVVLKTTSKYEEQNQSIGKKISNDRATRAFEEISLDFRKEKIFNPKFTFDNFVVGESNKYANAACLAVAQSPSEVYNPLFLYGGSGLGKTHLMNAIGIYLLEHTTDMKILYVSSETFTNDFIKAIQEKKTREFKNKYRKADVLLIDDIQFLEGKEGMQEEFFHTFNTLHSENKQIIISSDRPPNRLDGMDDRLRSRFASNMIANLSTPDYETRVAILMKKAENMNVEVDEDMHQIISLISEKIRDNIRELEGAFNRIISFSQIMGEKADVHFAKRILKDILVNGGNSITPEKIKSTVSKYYKIKVSDLESDTRKSSIAYARQISMYLCRHMTDYSFSKIGVLFGNKHYSTVKYACDRIQSELRSDKELQDTVEILKEEITK